MAFRTNPSKKNTTKPKIGIMTIRIGDVTKKEKALAPEANNESTRKIRTIETTLMTDIIAAFTIALSQDAFALSFFSESSAVFGE